ncbi:MAG: KAP family NTPase [Firmicutes bacterium]|nr:KAP family NTPase [Bacillota bacterium]
MSDNLQNKKHSFVNCVLHREPYANTIINIINNDKALTANNSFVIALDSPWGTGKTTFIKMLKSKIDNEYKNIHTVMYNAWENDYCENPFEPLFYDIIDNDVFRPEINKKNRTKLISCARKLPKALVKDFIEKTSGNNTLNVVNEVEDSIKVALRKSPPFIKRLKEERQAKIDFKECLLKTAETLKDEKLLIIIDELDRCKPLFAIKTLEIIKHLFDVHNITFLLSIDFSQLRHSISTVYGQNMDSEGYLRRFVNYVLKLPEPNKDNYISYLIKEKPLTVIYANKAKISDNVVTQLTIDLKNILVWDILSLRDINVIYENFRMFCNSRVNISDYDDYQRHIMGELLPCLVLMTFKYKNTDLYDAVIRADERCIDKVLGQIGAPNPFTVYLCDPKKTFLKKAREYAREIEMFMSYA